MKQNKNTVLLSILIQLILFCGTIFFIVSNINKFDFSFNLQVSSKFLLFVLLTFVLMIINWLLETLKWQILNREQKMTFSMALKSVLIGLLVGQLSPNRIAEPFARGLILPKNNYYQITVNAAISSFFQSLPTFFFGLCGLIFLVSITRLYQLKIIIYIGIAIVPLLFVVFLMFKSKIKLILAKYNSFFNQKKIDELFKKVLLLSVARYFVFILQNYLIFKSLKIEISLLSVFLVSSSIYFISSFFPSFFLLDLGIRGSLAVFLYCFFTTNIKGIIFVTYFVWFVNIVIPILFAIPLIKKLKFNIFEKLKPIKIWIFKN